MKARDVIEWIETLAPASLAMPDDPVGLQVGSDSTELTTVLVALDLSETVADEAVRLGAQLVVTHHPFLYRPLACLRTDTPQGRTISTLLKHDISVYSAHTNLDSCTDGVGDRLATLVGLVDTRPLAPATLEQVKLVTFVPVDSLEDVRRAICQAGAGHIGDYSECTYTLAGTGTFRGGAGTNPTLGTAGEFEEVDELRLETVVPGSAVETVVRVLKEVHPYEEVAYDLYPLVATSPREGLGRIGRLSPPIDAGELTDRLVDRLDAPGARIVGDADRLLKTVAICPGSGSSLLENALAAHVDAYVTGDIGYHTALEARDRGLVVIDIGHRAAELPVVAWLADRLAESFGTLEVVASRVDNEPFMYVGPEDDLAD